MSCHCQRPSSFLLHCTAASIDLGKKTYRQAKVPLQGYQAVRLRHAPAIGHQKIRYGMSQLPGFVGEEREGISGAG